MSTESAQHRTTNQATINRVDTYAQWHDVAGVDPELAMLNMHELGQVAAAHTTAYPTFTPAAGTTPREWATRCACAQRFADRSLSAVLDAHAAHVAAAQSAAKDAKVREWRADAAIEEQLNAGHFGAPDAITRIGRALGLAQ